MQWIWEFRFKNWMSRAPHVVGTMGWRLKSLHTLLYFPSRLMVKGCCLELLNSRLNFNTRIKNTDSFTRLQCWILTLFLLLYLRCCTTVLPFRNGRLQPSVMHCRVHFQWWFQNFWVGSDQGQQADQNPVAQGIHLTVVFALKCLLFTVNLYILIKKQQHHFEDFKAPLFDFRLYCNFHG